MSDVMATIRKHAQQVPCGYCGAGIGSPCRMGTRPYEDMHGARIDPIIAARGDGVREGISLALSTETTLVPLVGRAS